MRFLKRIHLSPGVSEALRNISWLGSDRIVRMAGAVLVGIVVARYLGPNQFGELNYALALYGLFNTLSYVLSAAKRLRQPGDRSEESVLRLLCAVRLP